MGVTVACFHAEGNFPVTIEVLIIVVRYETVTFSESFKKRSVMPSVPAEFVFFKCLMVNMIVLVSTGLGLKKSFGIVPRGLGLVWALTFRLRLLQALSKVVFPTLTKSSLNSSALRDSSSRLTLLVVFLLGKMFFIVFHVAAVFPLQLWNCSR